MQERGGFHLIGDNHRPYHLQRTQELDIVGHTTAEPAATRGRRHQRTCRAPRGGLTHRLKALQVYSPHTAVDCARGGLGDWLADIVTGTPTEAQDIGENNASPSKESPTKQPQGDGEFPFPSRPVYMLQHHPSQLSLNDTALKLGSRQHKRYPITRAKVEGYPGAGMGRIVRLAESVPLTDIIDRIGLGLGNPRGFPIAVPQGKQASEMMISSIGICAGSGGHLFSEMEKNGEEVDLLFTGELSHHEALAAIEKGKCVICLFHSNTERGFLHSVLKGQLEQTIGKEVSMTSSYSVCFLCGYADNVGLVAAHPRRRPESKGHLGRVPRRSYGRAL